MSGANGIWSLNPSTTLLKSLSKGTQVLMGRRQHEFCFQLNVHTLDAGEEDNDLLPNAANTGLAALEVTPGSLLRITSHTGDKHFADAAATLDPVGTAGHLVSMVVADGPVNTPFALLANHMESSLAAAVGREGTSTTIYNRHISLFFNHACCV